MQSLFVDINECKNPNTCDSNATCNNTIGSFNCSCFDRFVGNGTMCHNCDDCDQHAYCNEHNGNLICSCPAGYSGDGYSCECDLFVTHCDIDTGFAIDYNAICISERFPSLPNEYIMFVSAVNYSDHPESIPVYDNVSDACTFKG